MKKTLPIYAKLVFLICYNSSSYQTHLTEYYVSSTSSSEIQNMLQAFNDLENKSCYDKTISAENNSITEPTYASYINTTVTSLNRNGSTLDNLIHAPTYANAEHVLFAENTIDYITDSSCLYPTNDDCVQSYHTMPSTSNQETTESSVQLYANHNCNINTPSFLTTDNPYCYRQPDAEDNKYFVPLVVTSKDELQGETNSTGQETIDNCSKQHANPKFKIPHCLGNPTNNFYNIEQFNAKFLHILKILFYYRFNIAKFFIIFFNKQKNNINMYSNNSTSLMHIFIKHAIQFVENNGSEMENDVSVADATQMEKLRTYETFLSAECGQKEQNDALKHSKQYAEISNYNRTYLLVLSKKLKKSRGNPFYSFLHAILTYANPISRYFDMVVVFVKSLYDMKVIIDDKLNQSILAHLNSFCVFEVKGCCCNKETKQHFIFHWAICWIIYFSNNYRYPSNLTCNDDIYFIINSYPKEFFVQLIFLVHLVVNFNNENVTIKDLKNTSVIKLKTKIYEMLFLNNNNTFVPSLFQGTLQNMFNNLPDVYHNKIYKRNSALCTRIIQNSRENIILSNILIPVVQELIHEIIKLAKNLM